MKFPAFAYLAINLLGAEIPETLNIPSPGPTNDAPYGPQPILQGGVVIPLYPPGSPFLKADRVKEAEAYNLSRSVPGRINSITNIHNPSIEIHTVDGSINTGAAIILAAGGGHNTLNVGGESADFVPYFYNCGINTIILRNRLRRDGYNVNNDAVRDAMQAIRLVRFHAAAFKIDPKKIGIMGFSAGAELAMPAAVFFEEFDKTNSAPDNPLKGVSSRPDFIGSIYPGPSPFARGATPPVPRNAPPAFIICAGAGDRIHALWANEYFMAMLNAGVPNVELHIYGNGRHPGDPLPDGSRMTGGLTWRNGRSANGRIVSLNGSTISVFCKNPALRPRAPGIPRHFWRNPRHVRSVKRAGGAAPQMRRSIQHVRRSPLWLIPGGSGSELPHK